MFSTPDRSAAVSQKLRQAACFMMAGGLAFVVDAGMLLLLQKLGMPLLAGRGVSISLAMVVAWWLNRTLTFRVTAAPTWREFFGYAGLAAGVAVLNYALFAGLITTGLVEHPLLATALATLGSMVVSFIGMRFGVFRKQG